MTTADFQTEQEKRPPQQQDGQPGREAEMDPQPLIIRDGCRGSGKLEGRAARC